MSLASWVMVNKRHDTCKSGANGPAIQRRNLQQKQTELFNTAAPKRSFLLSQLFLPIRRQRRVKFEGKRFRSRLCVRQPVLHSQDSTLADSDHVIGHAWMNERPGVHLGNCSKYQRIRSVRHLATKSKKEGSSRCCQGRYFCPERKVQCHWVKSCALHSSLRIKQLHS